MQPNFKYLFPELPDESRVWIYSANRVLTDVEEHTLSASLKTFIGDWSTHGALLRADSAILLNRFLVIAADEQHLAASGCSIDASVRWVKAWGNQLNINFFDRLRVYVDTPKGIQQISYHALHEVSGFYYDPLIRSLKELRNHWPVVLS